MKIYYKKDIAEIIGRPLRTVTQWVDSGFIVPDVEESRGKGKARIFSESNVIEFAMFDLMSKGMGIQQSEIKYILDHLKGFKDTGFGFWLSYNEIRDFYTSEEWGHSKELTYDTTAYYDLKAKALKKGLGTFNLIVGERFPLSDDFESSDETDGDRLKGIRFSTSVLNIDKIGWTHLGGDSGVEIITVNENIFWLGTIKQIAIKQFGLDI